MSRTRMADAEQAEIKFGCGYCNAGPGAWCVVTNEFGEFNYWAPGLHASRYQQAYDVVRLTGWEQLERQTSTRYYALRREIGRIRDQLPALPNELIAALNKALMP